MWRETEGEWQVDVLEDGICATFYDTERRALAFALTADMVPQRRELIKHMDPSLVYGLD